MINVLNSILTAFILAIGIGKLLIPILRKQKIGQYIRAGQPIEHFKKAGTPIFGGFIFILSTVVTTALILKNFNSEETFVIYSFLIFGAIGFADDFLKTFKKNSEGLKIFQKLILILIGSAYLIYLINYKLLLDSTLIVPFISKQIDIGIFYIPFIIFFYTSVTNAVNLTDGLDGLAGIVTLLVVAFFCVVSLLIGKTSLAIICGALCASLLGFLYYNCYPAKIIMGDTGALALGGFVAAIAIVLKLPLIIPIVGGVYFIETLTTFIQIMVYKLTKRKVFKMTPIHYSFQLSGMHETKIVAIFSIATVILCVVGLFSLI